MKTFVVRLVFWTLQVIVGVLVIGGMYIQYYDPPSINGPVDCYMKCVQLEALTNKIGDSAVVVYDCHYVLRFKFYEDRRYAVYYGNKGGASEMRSGIVNEELWGRLKSIPWRDESSFWRKGRVMRMTVATNSVVCISPEELEVLRYAVSNAVPNGLRMLIDDVNPLVWNFLSPADTNQFWKKEDWMR